MGAPFGNRNAAGHRAPRGYVLRYPMAPEVRWRVCSAGGKAAWAKGVAHRFTHEEAVRAGKKRGRLARLRKLLKRDLE